ncbi:MAG: Ku protein [Patescibacteria group bacterium]|nr:Ku protein [Patescibacteria group bacterium]
MRALWTGSISFGLVNIPVSLYSASKERALSFRLLAKDDLCPISYKKVCREDDKPIDQKDIVKGYEVEKGEYVVLETADFKKAGVIQTELIDIKQFVLAEEIDSKLYDKPYYIEPQKKSVKAYALLRDALKKSGKVAVATFIMRDKQHIATIRPDGNILILDQLRYADEVRDPDEIRVPAKADYSKKELDLALSLIDDLTDTFNVKEYKDTFAEELMRIIHAKAKGQLKQIKKPVERVQATDVSDILAMLKKSLEKDKKQLARAR